jgi:hypothetical protein
MGRRVTDLKTSRPVVPGAASTNIGWIPWAYSHTAEESGMAAEPTFAEKSILFILMAEAREVPNALLRTRYQTELKKPGRDKLKGLGLISVRTEESKLYLDLTGVGAKLCLAEFGASPPGGAGSGSGGGALYAMLAAIKRYVDKKEVPYDEFFVPDASPPRPRAQAEIKALIREAYAALAGEPDGWVRLADLRDQLDGLDRAEFDKALVALNRTKAVRIVPESDQKALTQRDRDAAVTIGNQARHLLAISS